MDTLTDLLTAKIRQLETTLDHVGAYVYTKDMEGRYTYANKMVCELFGCPLEHVIGAMDEEFLTFLSLTSCVSMTAVCLIRASILKVKKLTLP